MIPVTDLKMQHEEIRTHIDPAIDEIINGAHFILGKQVALLEEEIARYCGSSYAVGVASGTDALVLSLAALGIGQGDEVITTPFTFIATAEAISRVGARPVFCDIDQDTFNLNPAMLERKITSHTKAIIPVHLYGLPCAMDRMMAIACQYGLKVVEDCAQSFGSHYRGQCVGSFGDCGCLSFFPSKTLGCCGDGGMVLVRDKSVTERMRMLRNHGSSTKYYYGLHGFNSRLDTLQAAILRIKLTFIDAWIQKRIAHANDYTRLLSGSDDLVTPAIFEGRTHTFNYYTVRVKKDRNLLQEHLKKNEIESAVHYPLCVHLQEVYKDLGYKKGDFPVAEQAQEEVLSLPMYPELSREQIETVVKVIKRIC